LLVQADRLVGGSDAVLVIDDTAIPKKGTHSVGVAAQYASALGKTANCQTLVSLTLARGEVPVVLALEQKGSGRVHAGDLSGNAPLDHPEGLAKEGQVAPSLRGARGVRGSRRNWRGRQAASRDGRGFVCGFVRDRARHCEPSQRPAWQAW